MLFQDTGALLQTLGRADAEYRDVLSQDTGALFPIPDSVASEYWAALL